MRFPFGAYGERKVTKACSAPVTSSHLRFLLSTVLGRALVAEGRVRAPGGLAVDRGQTHPCLRQALSTVKP